MAAAAGAGGGDTRSMRESLGAAATGDAIHVRVKDIATGQEAYVALGAWDTIGVLKKRLEGKGMGAFDMQRLVHAGRVLGNDETLMAAGVAKVPQVVLSVKGVDTRSTTGALNLQAAARGELPYVPPPQTTEVPRSWREQLEQESANNGNREPPTCRICHSDHNGSDDDRLFSPCMCRGSMRYVHVGCLNRWRALSNNPRSYYQCDSCTYKYNLQRTAFANYVYSYKVQEVLMVVTCVFLVVFFGGLSRGLKLESYLYQACDWFPPWHSAEYAAYRSTCDLVMSGLMVLGGMGFLLAAHKAYVDDARALQWNFVYLLAAYGTMVVRLLCFLGLLHSLRALHTRVEEEVKAMLSKFGDAILEVRPAAAASTASSAQHTDAPAAD